MNFLPLIFFVFFAIGFLLGGFFLGEVFFQQKIIQEKINFVICTAKLQFCLNGVDKNGIPLIDFNSPTEIRKLADFNFLKCISNSIK